MIAMSMSTIHFYLKHFPGHFLLLLYNPLPSLFFPPAYHNTITETLTPSSVVEWPLLSLFVQGLQIGGDLVIQNCAAYWCVEYCVFSAQSRFFLPPAQQPSFSLIQDPLSAVISSVWICSTRHPLNLRNRPENPTASRPAILISSVLMQEKTGCSSFTGISTPAMCSTLCGG